MNRVAWHVSYPVFNAVRETSLYPGIIVGSFFLSSWQNSEQDSTGLTISRDEQLDYNEWFAATVRAPEQGQRRATAAVERVQPSF